MHSFRYKAVPGLGTWVGNQRAIFVKGNLDPDRQAKLNDIGFEWVVRDNSTKWDERYKQLQAYKKEKGDCLVPNR